MEGVEISLVQHRMMHAQKVDMAQDLLDAKHRWSNFVRESQIVAMRAAQELALIRLAWPILTQIRTPSHRERQS